MLKTLRVYSLQEMFTRKKCTFWDGSNRVYARDVTTVNKTSVPILIIGAYAKQKIHVL